jgi:hypothetical protein
MGKTVPQPAAMLLDFIGSKEAPKGYDTVYANRMDRMPKPLTRMTMKEILDQGRWRTKTFGSSAFSRYQFMDATLRDLATKDTGVQMAAAIEGLAEAGRKGVALMRDERDDQGRRAQVDRALNEMTAVHRELEEIVHLLKHRQD